MFQSLLNSSWFDFIVLGTFLTVRRVGHTHKFNTTWKAPDATLQPGTQKSQREPMACLPLPDSRSRDSPGRSARHATQTHQALAALCSTQETELKCLCPRLRALHKTTATTHQQSEHLPTEFGLEGRRLQWLLCLSLPGVKEQSNLSILSTEVAPSVLLQPQRLLGAATWHLHFVAFI